MHNAALASTEDAHEDCTVSSLGPLTMLRHGAQAVLPVS